MERRFCYGCMRPKQQSPICEHCGYDERQLNMKHQLPIGTVLNNQYILGKVLGQGGFGITYIGWDRLLDMPVAIKEYFPNGIVYRNVTAGPNVEFYSGNDEKVFLKHKDRFMREARTLAQLASLPEIVQVKTFFEANNTAYIVMEFVEGITLKNYLKHLGRPLTFAETMQVMGPVLRGLSRVHEKNLIHRDISPDNIMLQRNGGVKLIDFGTVRYMNDMQRSKSTESVLKPGFAPMEQYNTQGNIGTWTDVYALCATFHYCLTGKLPADAPSRIENGERLTILESTPGIPAGFVRIMEKGMRIRSNERIQTVAELEHLLRNPSGFTPITDTKNTGRGESGNSKFSFKNIILVGIGLIAALILVGVLVIAFGNGNSSDGVNPSGQYRGDSGTDSSAWEDNVLMRNYLDLELEDKSSTPVFDHPSIQRKDIRTVTFLDSLDDMPSDSWDVSDAGDGSVMAWVDDRGVNYDLYIAADGGVNGSKACPQLFQAYINVTEIRFNGNFHTDNAEEMLYMFRECWALQDVDTETLDTSSCTDMFAMFDECRALTELDVSRFDTGNVTDMALMFSDCNALEELDVRNFETGNVIDMALMFYNCETLTSLDIHNFDTSNVWDMSYMFWGCNSLETLKLGDFNTGSVTNSDSFYHLDTLPDGTNWNSLFDGSGESSASSSSSSGWRNNVMMADSIDLDLENGYDSLVLGHSYARRKDIRTVTFVDSLSQMGSGSWDISYSGDGSVMAWLKDSGSSSAKYDLYIGANGGVNGKYVTRSMFREYINVTEIRFNRVFHTEEATNMAYMFQDCFALTKVDVETLDTSSCTDMFGMFDNCQVLTNLNVSNFDTGNVTDMALMFCDCHNLKSIDVSSFDTGSVEDMAFMFDRCESLTSLDVSNFDTASVWDMSYMFYHCDSLRTLKLGTFNTSSVTSYGCFYHHDTLPDGTYWARMFS